MTIIDQIKKLLSRQTHGLKLHEKQAYLKALGFSSWGDVLESSDNRKHRLLTDLKNRSVDFRIVTLNGSKYSITQPKGNRSLKNIYWSNEAVTRSLK